MRKITLGMLIVLIAGTAMAQPGRDSRHERPDFDRPPREMLDGFRLFKLTEELGLNEDQTAKIYPLLAGMNREFEKQQEVVQAKVKELRSLLAEDKMDTHKAAGLAMDIHRLRGEISDRHHAIQGKVLDLLDDEQKATYVLFDQMFDRHLREVKERMHERFGDKRGHFDASPEHFKCDRDRDSRERN